MVKYGQYIKLLKLQQL